MIIVRILEKMHEALITPPTIVPTAIRNNKMYVEPSTYGTVDLCLPVILIRLNIKTDISLNPIN